MATSDCVENREPTKDCPAAKKVIQNVCQFYRPIFQLFFQQFFSYPFFLSVRHKVRSLVFFPFRGPVMLSRALGYIHLAISCSLLFLRPSSSSSSWFFGREHRGQFVLSCLPLKSIEANHMNKISSVSNPNASSRVFSF